MISVSLACVFVAFQSLLQMRMAGSPADLYLQTSTPAAHTPRKLVTDPRTNFMYILEGDHNTLSPAVLAAARASSDSMELDDAQPPKQYGMYMGEWDSQRWRWRTSRAMRTMRRRAV